MDLSDMAFRSRQAFYDLSVASLEQRNQILLNLVEELSLNQDHIFQANSADYIQASSEGLSSPLLKRLLFDKDKMKQVQKGLLSLCRLNDPIGNTVFCHEITENLKLYRVTCPIGVIGVIFESRPDALIQISSLAVKSGNAVLLKGGRESLRTNQELIQSVRNAIEKAGLSPDCAQLMETREDVAEMLKQDEMIDLIIPRGSNAFVRYIMDHSRIPVLGHADGICHVYVDCDAEIEMALRVALDSKIQNLSVCNAEETLLVHQDIAPAFLPRFAELLHQNDVEIRGDDVVQSIISCKAATEQDWKTEYLDAILSIRIVASVEEAISHINLYGSHHTDCIVTDNMDTASVFLNRVDSAGVYLNVSTRFADGFVYGLGAEVGISTGKLHSRGPMGLDGLTTYKYKLLGNGQTMEEMKSGSRKYTHRSLNENCPI